jgi:hypothetical protein
MNQFGNINNNSLHLCCFVLQEPPTGSQVITFNTTATYVAVNVIYYKGVQAVGTLQSATGNSTSAAMNVVSSSQTTLYSVGATSLDTTMGTSTTGFTQRAAIQFHGGVNYPILMGDGLGNGGTLSLSCSLSASAAWTIAALPLA